LFAFANAIAGAFDHRNLGMMQQAVEHGGDAGGVGTSKWNKVEHRLFSFISSNWRGEPLRDYETIVNLIAKTTTAKGLTVNCRLDRRKYPTGRKVSAEQMKQVNLYPDKFHGEWNYLIKPHRERSEI
jgi:Rhodopirellula transposase DDE domain